VTCTGDPTTILALTAYLGVSSSTMIPTASLRPRAVALLACLTAAASAACSSGGDTTSSATSGAGGASSSSAASASSQGGGSAAGSTSSGGVTSSGASTSGTGGAPSAAAGTIVPLYSNPSDPAWKAIVAAKQAHPSVAVRAIINPNSGPGDAKDPEYVTGIASLDAAGIVVLAYVATTYGKKAPAAAKMEIDAYVGWYPGLKGIFFDEMSNTAGDEAYYKGLDQYSKGKGVGITVGNPGTETLSTFVGTVDTILIYESEGIPAVGSLGVFAGQYDRSNFGVIPYGVPSLDAAFVAGARPSVGFIYMTDDTVPNPWDTLPAYFPGLLATLE
jgi:spherulation-specific family 4 protein